MDGQDGSRALNVSYVVEDGTTTEIPNYYARQSKLIPPLPLRVFTSDAEVVLPQAYTATQLFGVERHTGIELEAAAVIAGLCSFKFNCMSLHEDNNMQL